MCVVQVVQFVMCGVQVVQFVMCVVEVLQCKGGIFIYISGQVCDISRHFRNKKKAYLKAKIEELETNIKIKNSRYLYRGVNDFKKGYQPRTTIEKDEKGDLVADSCSIMARWRNFFSQLLNAHDFDDVRQVEIHTPEPLVPEPNAFEFELLLNSYKFTNHQILMKSQQNWLKQVAGQFAVRSIHLLILFGIRRNYLSSGRSTSLYVPVYKKVEKNRL
jgi:hypothetical protein